MTSSADASVNRTQPQPVVLVLLLREGPTGREVLLGRKLTGFGAGNVVAPGGKIEPGESPVQAAVRELAEETGMRVVAGDLAHRANIAFRFPASPRSDMDCRVFVATVFGGQPAASGELDARWYPAQALPVRDMWQDAERWLPLLLDGQRFTATVQMAPDNLGVANLRVQQWDGDAPA
ncbi:8-oxo-dGTP diphosphatase [Glutamicibacter creatinolyticus]